MGVLVESTVETGVPRFRKGALPVLATGTTLLADGRDVPLVIVDATGRLDLTDLTRVHRLEGPEGEHGISWEFGLRTDPAACEAVMVFTATKPVRGTPARVLFRLGDTDHLEAVAGAEETGAMAIIFTKPKHLRKVLHAPEPAALVVESRPEAGLRDGLEMFTLLWLAAGDASRA